MIRTVWTLTFIACVALLQTPVQLQGQPLSECPPPGGLSSAERQITIGHFAESAAAIGEFCRYLLRNDIRPLFQNLGSLRTDATVRHVQAALEAGEIDVLWLSSLAMAELGSASTLVMKVLAVTDFPVIHVVSWVGPNVKTRLVSDAAFAPTKVIVTRGFTEVYADILLKAIGVASPRCLEAPVGCEVQPNDGTLVGGLISFLMNQPSKAAVYVSSTFSPKSPDPIMLSLLQTQFTLVGIPSPVVIKMSDIRGAFAAVSIPKGHYGVGRNPNVPAADVPTAAAPLMLVSSTPPKVAERVRSFVRLINSALLGHEERVSPRDLRTALELARDLRESLRGRVILHEEFARELELRGLPTILPSPTLPPVPCGSACGEPGPKGSRPR